VYYATDRHRRPLAWKPDLRFTGERSEHGNVWLGRARVSFPPTHRVTIVERPSVLRLLLKEDTSRHVVIDELSELSLDEYATSVAAHVAKSRQREALIYVHGYNVRFGDAVRRTAQIAYDLKFEGAAIAFSWPSLGRATGYVRDEASVLWSAAHVETFLQQLSTRMGVERIHVVSHNTGARAVIDALQHAARTVDAPSIAQIQQLVFAAPDVDADLFRRAAPRLTAVAERVTLYASSNDAALAASRALHDSPRAGQSEPRPVVVPGVDTVVTSARSTFLGHSYYLESGTIVPDLYYLLRTGAPPEERAGLVRQRQGELAYWVLGL
jgi:esterase/lipase superfamily enzyme